MSKLLHKLTLALIASLLFVLFPISYLLSPTFAAGNLITVTPQITRLDLSKDAPEAEITYTNSTSETIELSLSMRDVKELEDRGIPGLLNNNDASNYKYGLSSWATFSSNQIVVKPGEAATVTVFIDSDRLSIGGHYASVLAEIKQQNNGQPVKVRAVIASLLFVRTGGGKVTEKADLSDVRVTNSWLSFPYKMSFRLKNSGNVELVPYGIVEISDPLGRIVTHQIVNEDSLITLPESIRKYSLPVTSNQKILVPGIYKINLDINYGVKKTSIKSQAYFFTLGSIPLPALLVIAAFWVALATFLMKRNGR